MEKHIVKILSIHPVTHNVKRFRIEKPIGYHFVPGQATEVSINKSGWANEKRPFTFTCLNEESYLEFTIKIYTDHQGVTNELGKLVPGDELIIRDVWGAISYNGPGYFIAGGAGITPFIAILRQLKKDSLQQGNKLFFSNLTPKDIILEEELISILGKENIIFITTQEHQAGYDTRYINKDFLQSEVSDFTKNFYVCGPDAMVEDINKTLLDLGANPNLVVFEK